MRRSLVSLFALATLILASPAAHAWDYEGHRTVNRLALASLPKEMPDFLRTPEAATRIAFLSGEPDRWKSTAEPALRHLNPPDHFFDLEDLDAAGMPLSKLSEFRYVFTAQLAAARAAHPERFPSIDPDKNQDHTRELIGFLPWSIAESFAKLKAEFSYLKAYEEHGTPTEIANAKANIIYVMGVMGHYVGDAAQPLHTTKHHNGWVGENPGGYTTSRGFHAWIDGGFMLKTGGFPVAELTRRSKPAALLPSPAQPNGRSANFENVLAYLSEQHAKVEPLYQLEKNGAFTAGKADTAKGRAFLENQLLTAGQMLGRLWLTAWREAPPDTYLLSQLVQRKSTETSSAPKP